MTLTELHQRYVAKREALNAHATGDGVVHDEWLRAYDRLRDRPPVLRTKADALTVLEFLEEEINDSAICGLEPLLKRLRAYIEGGAS